LFLSVCKDKIYNFEDLPVVKKSIALFY